MTEIEGGCLCRAIRYRITSAPLAALACHCRDCQYLSGGAEANVVVVPAGKLKRSGASEQVWRSAAASGATVWRSFCPTCGTPLFAGNDRHPEMVSVKVGSLDDPSAFQRQLHIWMASAQPWHLVEPGLPALPGNPPGVKT